jgi:O-antigen ligase
MTVIKTNNMDAFVNSQRYSLFMFVVCILYTLTALPRLDISDLLKNIIIFGSLPYLYLNYKHLNKKVFWLILLAISIQIISWVNSLINIPDIAKSRPNLNPLTSIFLFILVSIWISNVKWRRQLLFLTLIFSFSFTAIYDSIINNTISLGLSGERIDFGMHNSQFTSMLSAVVMMLSTYLLVEWKKQSEQKSHTLSYFLFFTILVLAGFALLASQSRQVWLALVFVVVISPIFIFKRSNLNKIILIYLVAALSIYALLQIDTISQRAFKESNIISLLLHGEFDNIPMTSIGIRVNSWIEATKWIIERPILGSDFNAIPYVIRESELFINSGLTRYGHLHSTYIETLVAYGLSGVLLYIVFYKEILSNIYKNQGRDEIILVTCFLIFWAIINIFESFNHKGLGLYAHTIVLGGLYTLQRKKET